MNLNILWFLLIGILYTGYFVLEGFDLGVGMLLPFLSKEDHGRRIILNTIGPHWDGNEVWLLTAGGATFAAFPGWYATLFSGFYLPLFLILIGLILRGIAIEFRSKDDNPIWRNFWDWALCVGSFLPALLVGVAFANFIRGVPIDAQFNYVGGFWNLLNPFALVGGLVSLTGFLLQGGLFLTLKTTSDLTEKIRRLTTKLWIVSSLTLVLFSIISFFTNEFNGMIPVIISILAILCMLITGWTLREMHDIRAFLFNSLAIIFASIALFSQLFPRVLISSVDDSNSLTIYNVSSSPYTLHVMSIVALIFVPIILAYQAWTYWVFRKRVTGHPKSLNY